MLNMTSELKAKLLAAKSEEEVTKLLKADGQEITAEETKKLWTEIEQIREAEGRKLSIDELDAISAGSGAGLDLPKDCTLMFQG